MGKHRARVLTNKYQTSVFCPGDQRGHDSSWVIVVVCRSIEDHNVFPMINGDVPACLSHKPEGYNHQGWFFSMVCGSRRLSVSRLNVFFPFTPDTIARSSNDNRGYLVLYSYRGYSIAQANTPHDYLPSALKIVVIRSDDGVIYGETRYLFWSTSTTSRYLCVRA